DAEEFELVTRIDNAVDAGAADVAIDLNFFDLAFGNDVAEEVAARQAIASGDLAHDAAFGEDSEPHRAHVLDVDVGDSADGGGDVRVLGVVDSGEALEIGTCASVDAAGEGASSQAGRSARGDARGGQYIRA